MRIAVIGTGLIGASVGLAARRRDHHVAGFDPDERALAVASDRGALDEPVTSIEGAVAEADLAVVAAPVAQLVPTVEAVLAASADGCSVTDVGSTKARVATTAGSPRFVGGHPVCGSEAVLEEELDGRYMTLCDPRLNGRQSLDLAFRLAELMRS